MNILHINTRYIGGGGAAAIANLLHNEINKQEGMSSRFLYGRGQSDDKNSVKIAYEFESYISAGFTRILGDSKNRKLSEKSKREIDNADIIHIHNLHGYYLDYESLINYIVEKDKKIIWTLHDTWAFTGRCAFTFGCEKWKNSCGSCQNLSIYPTTNKDISDKLWNKKRNIFNKLNKNKTLFITPSKWLKGLIEQSFLKDFKVEVINNGVEKSDYINVDKNILREEFNIPKDKKVILFVAADPNDERKGIKYILNIIDKFDDNVLFVSIGKRIDIENEKFLQLGYLSNRKEIYKIYRLSDLFIIPSMDDNFPTTVLEAYANGIPVVGFNTGGISEQITENTGVLVKNISNEEFRKEILSILTNDSKLEILAQNAKIKFKNEYILDVFVSNYKEVYKKVGD